MSEPSNRNQYLHQHHLHISEENLIAAKAQGWLTFSFLRMPAETICSLFHWRRQQFKQCGIDMLFGQDKVNESFGQFWDRLIAPDSSENMLWALPSYYESIDHVDFFSVKAISDFCDKYFHYPLKERKRVNASENPGVSAHIANDSLTPDMIQRLESHPRYQHFLSFCQRRELTCPS
jgi:hypothetical protein